MRSAIIGPRQPVGPESWGPGYRLWLRLRGLVAQRGPEGTISLARLASHVAIVLIVSLVLLAGRVHLPVWEIAQNGDNLADSGPAAGLAENPQPAPALQALVRAAVPLTTSADRSAQTADAALAVATQPRTAVAQYTVQPGDTLYGIAEKYNVSAETLMWANNMEANPDLLRLGQELIILPVSGILHTVQKGDTLQSIAKKYSADVAGLLTFPGNALSSEATPLTAGQKLIVPGGSKPRVVVQAPAARAVARPAAAPGNAPVGRGHFVWPTSGSVTQGYRALHHALDIAAPMGTPVRAADSGYVLIAGWSNDGYGNHIMIDHGNGYVTLYGHLSRIGVQPGQVVQQGDLIGNVGSTGNSTGSHLHFEIRQNSYGLNPYNFLP
jgi:murein DD-endopeptidase MepM/ murein hydrolase activator NlpD